MASCSLAGRLLSFRACFSMERAGCATIPVHASLSHPWMPGLLAHPASSPHPCAQPVSASAACVPIFGHMELRSSLAQTSARMMMFAAVSTDAAHTALPRHPPLTCVLRSTHSRIIRVLSGGCSVGKLIIVDAELGGFRLMPMLQNRKQGSVSGHPTV
jgi:hypothetical protein